MLLTYEVRWDHWEGVGLWREKCEAREDTSHLGAGRPRPLGGPRRRAGSASAVAAARAAARGGAPNLGEEGTEGIWRRERVTGEE